MNHRTHFLSRLSAFAVATTALIAGMFATKKTPMLKTGIVDGNKKVSFNLKNLLKNLASDVGRTVHMALSGSPQLAFGHAEVGSSYARPARPVSTVMAKVNAESPEIGRDQIGGPAGTLVSPRLGLANLVQRSGKTTAQAGQYRIDGVATLTD